MRRLPIAAAHLDRVGGEPAHFVLSERRLQRDGRYAVVVYDGPDGAGRDVVEIERVRDHMAAVGAAEHAIPFVVAGAELSGLRLRDAETGADVVLERAGVAGGAPRPVRVAVLVSGGGTTLQNFLDRIDDGRLAAEVTLVLSSSDGAYALERAARADIPSVVVRWPGVEREREFHDAITAAVEESGAELVAMGGFLRLWRFPERWSGRVLNIHPGLLPAFGGKGMYGHHVHEAVVASGAERSGCTVHIADHEYDRGPIVLQREVAVLPDDTPDDVAARVFEAECEVYPEALNLFAAGRLRIVGDRVQVLPDTTSGGP